MVDKVIRINTPKGQYDLDLMLIAQDRAKYYANKEGFKEFSEEWQDEIDFVMEDDFEGIDWLVNNHNWEDFEKEAVKINSKVFVTDEDFWTSSEDFEILNSGDEE